MSNMSYCRFQNTLADLRDCQGAIDAASSLEEMDLSAQELQALHRMVVMMREMVESYDVLTGDAE